MSYNNACGVQLWNDHDRCCSCMSAQTWHLICSVLTHHRALIKKCTEEGGSVRENEMKH